MNEQEIINEYSKRHEDLSQEYYNDPDNYPGGKEAFDYTHGNIWKDMEAHLVLEGYRQLPGPTIEERVKALEDKTP